MNSHGDTPPLLDLELRWLPSERRVTRSVRTAAGLCVVHWRGEEAEVALVVRGVHGEARTTLRRDRADAHRVVELRLAPAGTSEPTSTTASPDSTPPRPADAAAARRVSAHPVSARPVSARPTSPRPPTRAEGEMLGAEVDPLNVSGAY